MRTRFEREHMRQEASTLRALVMLIPYLLWTEILRRAEDFFCLPAVSTVYGIFEYPHKQFQYYFEGQPPKQDLSACYKQWIFACRYSLNKLLKKIEDSNAFQPVPDHRYESAIGEFGAAELLLTLPGVEVQTAAQSLLRIVDRYLKKKP
jgi:hypothetical protein